MDEKNIPSAHEKIQIDGGSSSGGDDEHPASFVIPDASTTSDNGTAVVKTMITVHDNNDDYDDDDAQTKAAFTKKWWEFWKTEPSDVDPLTFSTAKKYMILFIIASAGTMAPISSTVYYPALVNVQEAFNTTDTAVNASVSLFVFVTAICPLMWASWSDRGGRRNIYLLSFAITVVGTVLCAVSVNIAMLIVFRGISAVGASSVQSMGAGTLSDIYDSHERGRAYAWYVLGPIMGPAIGPIIGGFLTEAFGWRATFWFSASFGLGIFLLILFFLPETFRHKEKVQAIAEEEGIENDNRSKELTEKKRKHKIRFANPLSPLRFLLFPNVSFSVLYLGILFGVYYLMNTSFAWVFANQYKLDSGIIGVCYLPAAIGGMIGGNIGGRLSDFVYNNNVKKATDNQQTTNPEMRLSIPLLGVVALFLLGVLTGYGWTVKQNVHYAAPMAFSFFVSGSIMLPHVTLTTYLVDSHRSHAASATSCNNLSRYLFAGVGTLTSSDLMRAMGTGILFTGCGVLIVLLGLPVLYVKMKPQKWAQMRKARGL
ncbi:major facilitator superfamily domain-containing protein [Zychaea mexicana]|uniref:major facilitator superfamily domain-containing protein n=1 Tax=Zychaea mexicana TaxID=64656 RepID=UPI0022FDE25D|nr:major facilitator superfamily domain-containing protein [Zychaea mexicana]KAI9496395.1 major facilitator superfamily domain-containing protein [Zychaea mexicana]